jgi:Fe-Mn family superoxide dismutase
MTIALPPLPYDYDALEPVISSATLKLHHGTHHRGYIEKLNALIKGSELEAADLETIVRRSAAQTDASAVGRYIFNHAAQAWNHAFFWNSLRPKQRGGGAPRGALAARIAAEFGDERQFARAFKSAALGVFGSGWAWLVAEQGELRIVTTANADTPIVHAQTPLLVLDVWEHAYYLDYQSRRDAYSAAVVDQLLNWEFAQRNFPSEEALHA